MVLRRAFNEHMRRLDFYLDLSLPGPAAAAYVRDLLRKVLAGLEDQRSEKESTCE
jgi:hypothetical protein